MERKVISSDRSISSHKPEDKKYFVPVKNHPKLFLMVRSTETKSWMYRYYPIILLAEFFHFKVRHTHLNTE